MNVSLIDYTGYGQPASYAADILIFTKSTRLEMKPGLLKEIHDWDEERRNKELAYMANTIPSSWEMVNYTFSIEGVSRAFTHQFVRNRQGSYAQQTMRVLDVGGFEYITGPTIKGDPRLDALYRTTMNYIEMSYRLLIDKGASIEDARGILPTNIATNITAKYNLRTLSELARKRASARVQEEFRVVLASMVARVLEVHPWAVHFLAGKKQKAIKEAHDLLSSLEDKTLLREIAKRLDLIAND